MAETVSTNESESFWEWGGDLIESVAGGMLDVEKEKAKNPQPIASATNTASPAQTVIEAKQTPQSLLSIDDKTKMYIGVSAGFLLFIVVLMFAFRSKK